MNKYMKKIVFTAIALPTAFVINGGVGAVFAENMATINFDNLTAGTQIDSAAQNWSVAKVDGSTMIAEVSSKMAKSAPNSLYLSDDSSADKPYALLALKNSPAASGSVSFDAYIPSTNAKTVYVNFGTGKNNSQRYFELRFNGKNGIVEYENGSDDVKIGSFTTDKWHNINASWSDGKFSISLDGVISPEATNVDVASTGLSTDNIPTTVTFYAGDKSSSGTSVYIDNIQSDLLK